MYIVEDGTGFSDANSYVDMPFADAYFARIKFTAWANYSEEEKENILITGGEYADLRWGLTLKGTLFSNEQALLFPRRYLYDRYDRVIDGVPTNWKKAVCEYGMQSTKADLIGTTVNADAALTKKKTVVGPITTEKEFADVNTKTKFTVYPKADSLVREFISYNVPTSKAMRN